MAENLNFKFFSGQIGPFRPQKWLISLKKTGHQKYGCYNCKRRIILIAFLVQLCCSGLIIGSTHEL